MLRKEARMVNDAILQNIQTDNTWVDVETVAFLKNISKRGVRLSLKTLEFNICNKKDPFGSILKNGADDGIRTHAYRNHNPRS